MNRKGRAALVLALVGVVGMAFRVSWNALRDIAGAIGADDTAAVLYPFVVDGLMALALVATLVLVDDDRKFALRVLGTYTIASLVLNYVHGLVPELHGRSVELGRVAEWDAANWALVLLATSLPVGSIYFGSDLVAKVLHHRPAPIPTATTNAEESTETDMKRSTADLPESTPAPTVTLTRLRVPDPVAIDLGKSTLPLKPVRAVAAPIPMPVVQAVPAGSIRPRGVTGKVPPAARSPRPKRTPDQLLAEARSVTAGWTDAQITAEGIRRAVHTSPVNARLLRDTLLAERGQQTAPATP
ncbi:DUF2637 domain-containing protein [Streptomyces sp. NPDC057456]|uniref:DUF2637 domain-containing protein n=1 Tax=unclassified Streptomyces TaxID=2593676 RepID=UPI00070A8BA8|nr:DUF2637 domain-containing protein [Streptomyces sp. Root1310]KQX80860.1 hypothetical protein ASD48_32515 [Streptomyces sp. Root1310]